MSDEKSQDPSETTTVAAKIPIQDVDKLEEDFENKSKGLRHIIRLWANCEEELNNERLDEFIEMLNHESDRLEPSEQVQQMYITLMKSYRNSIEKNIQLLKSERDKLNSRIEELEEKQSAEGDDDVIMTIKLDIDEEEI